VRFGERRRSNGGGLTELDASVSRPDGSGA